MLMLGGANPLGGDLPYPYTGGPVGFGPNAPAIPIDQIGIPPATAFPQRRGIFGARMANPSPDMNTPINQQIAQVPAGAGEAALANLSPAMLPHTDAPPRPGFFGRGGAGRAIIGGLGDGLLEWAGQRPVYGPAVRQQRDIAAERARQQRQFANDYAVRLWQRNNQIDDRNFKASQPQYFTAGNDRIAYDPTTGQSDVLYHGNQPFEDYAAALGLKQGTPEYAKALQDYVLRGNGPTAYGYDLDLEGARQRNRIALRQTPSYAQTHPRAPTAGGRGQPTLAGTIAPILAKVAHGETLTPGEQTALDTYYHRGGKGGRGGRGSGGITKVATNPQTGEKVGWNGSAWVPVQ
jgi:hypothetical protein